MPIETWIKIKLILSTVATAVASVILLNLFKSPEQLAFVSIIFLLSLVLFIDSAGDYLFCKRMSEKEAREFAKDSIIVGKKTPT